MSDLNIICLMDFENVIRAQAGVNSQKGDLTKRVMKHLNSLLRERGRLITARAYADWRQYGKEANIVEDTGFELVYASQRQNGKNSADIRLVLDAMDVVHTGRAVHELVIVSGDSDMIPLIQRVRSHGVRVTVITERQSASGRLSAYADEIVYIEALQGTAPNQDYLEQAERIVVRALRNVNPDARVYGSRLKDDIIRLHPAFNERNLGFSKFSDFLVEMEKKGHLRLEWGEGGLSVRPNLQAAPAARAPAARATRPPSVAPSAVESEVETRLLAVIRKSDGQFIDAEVHRLVWRCAVQQIEEEGLTNRSDVHEAVRAMIEQSGLQDITKTKVARMLSLWVRAGALRLFEGEYEVESPSETAAIDAHNNLVLALAATEQIPEQAVVETSLWLYPAEGVDDSYDDYTEDEEATSDW